MRPSETWDPWQDVQRLRDEVMRVFERGLPFGFPAEGEFPLINIRREPERVTIEVLAPSIVRGSLDVTAAGGRLTIRGERRVEAEVPDERYHRREHETGASSARVPLPADVDAEKATATCKKGTLTIRVPKTGRDRPGMRRIAVST